MDDTLSNLGRLITLSPWHLVHEIIQSMAFVAAFYVAGAALCRLRKTPLKMSWSALYTALLGNALWFIFDMLNGQVSDKDIAVLAAVSWYVFLTRSSWQHGVPLVARGNH